MTMLSSYNENFDYGLTDNAEFTASESSSRSADEKVLLISDKLCVPETENHLVRPRLIRLLEKSLKQFGATLITGRAGTGKTDLAAHFSQKFEDARWYSVNSGDLDWKVFSAYFCRCIFGEKRFDDFENDVPNISLFVENLFARPISKQSRLIVLDNLHYVFDAEWFSEFFTTLLYSVPPNVKLLFLARSQPELPLWRLRSKQVLGVLDEKVLSFTLDEAKKYYKSKGISSQFAEKAFNESSGRISKL